MFIAVLLRVSGVFVADIVVLGCGWLVFRCLRFGYCSLFERCGLTTWICMLGEHGVCV